jgi:hypothetical protein
VLLRSHIYDVAFTSPHWSNTTNCSGDALPPGSSAPVSTYEYARGAGNANLSVRGARRASPAAEPKTHAYGATGPRSFAEDVSARRAGQATQRSVHAPGSLSVLAARHGCTGTVTYVAYCIRCHPQRGNGGWKQGTSAQAHTQARANTGVMHGGWSTQQGRTHELGDHMRRIGRPALHTAIPLDPPPH